MSDRTKELILKTLMVIDFGLLIAMFPGCFLIGALITDEEMAERILYTIMFAFFVGGLVFAILLPIFAGLKQTPIRAEKIPLPFQSYDKLAEFLQESLNNKTYTMQGSLPIGTNGEVIIYTKALRLWVLECFTIIRVPELSDEMLEIANNHITEMLTEYYGGRITDTINMTSVFCVDRITSSFQKLVNSNLEQGLKNGRFNVGISFGGKKIYLSQQKDGFAIKRYKQLRKNFLEIMGISEKQENVPNIF